MSANLDVSKGFVALAFTGPRSKVWHKTGNSVDQWVAENGRQPTVAEWATLSGSNFTVEARPLFYTDATGLRHDYPDRFANVRIDTDAALGLVSDRYSLVQPLDVQETFAAIIAADDRFGLTTMGSLDGGKRVWAQAEFTGEQTIAGDRHRAKLLMSTTFDTTSPTRLQGCVERVVCENTIRVAMGEHAPTVDVRHNSKFDRDTAIKKLAKIAEGFAQFKTIGDALAQTVMGELPTFLRNMLDIPADAKIEDVSTRKLNQRQAIIDALLVSANERGQTPRTADAFTVLQAITRYVDHDRDANNTSNRLFGSGAAFKDKALGLLMPLIADKVAA